MVTICRTCVLACASLFCWSQAHAGCVIGVPHPTFYVGSDNQCKYAKIQDAITDVSPTATCPPNIVVTNEHQPWNEALTITGRSFTLIGATGGCGISSLGASATADIPAAAPTSPQATISGAGLNAPVITINGNSHVTLQNLEITGGNLTGQNSEGGGIFFNGTGSLTLNATTIDGNQAAYGGGIDMSPTGSATLTLQANTLVLNNTAGISGGGIRIEGATRMFMLADGSSVSFNDAQFDYGGGIEILGPARADIGSSAVFVSAVSNNSAPYGGGIAILGSSGGSAVARLFSTSATQPVLISNNSASGLGGAVYLKPDAQNDVDTNATLCAYNYRIDSNAAPDGAAIYADYDTDNVVLYGSSVYFNPGNDCGPESPASLGAVACAVGTPCNEVSDNDAVDGVGNPSGAIISMNTYLALAVERLEMRGNHAAQMITADDPWEDTTNYLHGCLIADNHSAHELIHSDSGYFGDALTIANCTLANNTIDNGYAIFAVNLFTLTDTIIDQPGIYTMDHVESACATAPCLVSASYLMSNDISTLPSSSNILAIVPGDPLFVDSANGNYHLPAYLQNGLTASRAIDFAPTVSGNAAHDLDGNAYDQNVQVVPDLYGSRDLGAYEAVPITDRLFADGFGDRISLVH